MKLQYCSDLHLEFPDNKNYLKANPLQPKGDILLLAGDIVPFISIGNHKDFFNYVSDNFQFTYWIPGNHEYYYFDAATKSGKLNEQIRNNVFLVNNICVYQENLKLVFTTLWSKISPANEWLIEKGMSDFHVIKYNGYRFSSVHFNQMHEESIQFLQREQEKKHPGKTIVVTHHIPTFLNYPEKYKTDILNEAFAVELFDFIETSNIDYWIYGHHHTNTRDFSIGETKMLTNQLGYVKYDEHLLFDPAKTITLK
ncbi:MAG: Metallophosphoesterase [Segetibacter sp.]|nr:Metallophosphoesterase [Segetibacter sp.]